MYEITLKLKFHKGNIVYLKNSFAKINGKWKLKKDEIKRKYSCNELTIYVDGNKYIESWALESSDPFAKIKNIQPADKLIPYSEIGE